MGGGSAGGGGGSAVVCTYPKSVTITVSSITTATHWESGIYTLQSSLTVSGGVLQVDACTKIIMPIGGKISVRDNGALSLSGANGQIIITSAKTSPLPGDWAQLEFYGTGDSANNKFENVVVEYGGGANNGAIWIESGARVTMSNSTVRHSKDFGVEVENGGHLASFTGNALVNNALGPVMLGANSVDELGTGTYTPNTVQGISVVSEAVAHDATWLDLGVPYIAENGFSVTTAAGTAHLTISAGVILKVGAGHSVAVRNYGGLTLAGTTLNPITVTSAQGAPAAGDWSYIEIYSTSSLGHNKIDHAVIEYGGGAGYGAVWVESGAQLHMKDSTIRRSSDFGLELQNGAKLVNFTGNTLTENALGPVTLGANTVDSLGAGTYSGNTVEGVVIVSEDVSHDAQWLNLGVPYVAPSGFALNVTTGSAVLTIDPGVTLKIGAGQTISVRNNGGLTLNGNSTSKVTVTSAKSSPSAGDWNEIDLYSTSVDAKNVFNYADINYGGGSSYGSLWVEGSAGVTLDHVTFTGSRNCDVAAQAGSTVTATASPFVACP